MALQKLRPIVGHSLLWTVGIGIIIVGIIFNIQQLNDCGGQSEKRRLALAAAQRQADDQRRQAETIRMIEHSRVVRGIAGEWSNGSSRLTITKEGSKFRAEYPSSMGLQILHGEVQADNQLRLANTRQLGKLVRPGTFYVGDFAQEAWLQLSNDGSILIVTFSQTGGKTLQMKRTIGGAVINAPEASDNVSSCVTQQVEPTAEPDKQFILAEDTALDVKNGLMWTRDGGNMTKKRMNWIDADAYCRRLTLGGYSNWRLPTKKELETLKLIQSDKAVGYGDLRIVDFRNAPGSWSSTADPSHQDSAWVVYFDVDGGGSHRKSQSHWFRCVSTCIAKEATLER